MFEISNNNGEINLNGQALQNNLMGWRSLIGYVPQSIVLIDASIRENVALGFEEYEINDKKVWSVLREANLSEFVQELSDQLDTFIGENGMRLSGGQRQRLGLARALYHEPEVLVFDEATSSLDTEAERVVQHAINNLIKGRTTIIIAHRLSTIHSADKIFLMKKGAIIDSGNHEQLIQNSEEYKLLYKNQLK